MEQPRKVGAEKEISNFLANDEIKRLRDKLRKQSKVFKIQIYLADLRLRMSASIEFLHLLMLINLIQLMRLYHIPCMI